MIVKKGEGRRRTERKLAKSNVVCLTDKILTWFIHSFIHSMWYDIFFLSHSTLDKELSPLIFFLSKSKEL